MIFFKRNNTKTWIIIILLATNLATIISFNIQSRKVGRMLTQTSTTNMPQHGMNRFLIDKLNLREEQHIVFREARQDFMQEARNIRQEMNRLRIEMLEEMSNTEPDTQKIELISQKFGNQHAQLKMLTTHYFFKLKNNCDPEQIEKLEKVFIEMATPEEGPRHRKGRRKGRGPHHNKRN